MRATGVLKLVALAFIATTTGLLPAPAATAASGYCTGSGIDVVVDFGALGGGVQKACGDGSTAAAAFKSAGVSLRGTPRMTGDFVCTVEGKPTDQKCTATNAYWALFVAKPGGNWAYASDGVSTQAVRNGETVAFAWQSTGSKRKASVAPAASNDSKPSAGSTKGSGKGSGGGSDQSSGVSLSGGGTGASSNDGAGGAPTPTASGSSAAEVRQSEKSAQKRVRKKQKHARTSATTAPSSGVAASSTTAKVGDGNGDSGGGLPWWVPAGVVVLLAAGGGGVAWRRARGPKVP